MEKNRRQFVKGVGIFGAFAAAVVAGRSAVVDSSPKADPKMINIIEHQKPATIAITSTYGEVLPPPPPTPPSQYVFSDGSATCVASPTWVTSTPYLGNFAVTYDQSKFKPGTEKVVTLKLVPGPDGKLYVNINGEWKEVLTT